MQAIEKQEMKGTVQEMGTFLNELFFDKMQTVEHVGEKLDQLAKDMRELPYDDIINGYVTFMREFEMLSKLMSYTMKDYQELKKDVLSLQHALEDLSEADPKEKA